MPLYRFHVVVAGEVSAPDVDLALLMVDEFVQAGNSLPADIQVLDAQVHRASKDTYLQGAKTADQQISMFYTPLLVR